MDAAGKIRDHPAYAPRATRLGGGRDWSLYEAICTAGPQDRPFEEQHGSVTIAAVVAGTFNYHTDAGRGLVYPGALMLGNAGACYRCGHEHGSGDRCIALHLSSDYFAEIAASAARSSRFRFPAAMLPAIAQTLPLVACMESGLGQGDLMEIEEAVVGIAETVIRLADGGQGRRMSFSTRDSRRIGAILRYIAAHSDEPVSLDQLASRAAMSKYHFLRVFRHVTGTTPHKFILSCRMRRAAAYLAASSASVSSVAFAAGFGDLSTFNHRFRSTFGMNPKAFRARMS